ncbi:MAG: sigma-70 family RNA polymerase sigma factor [Armatimonas sp.]
MSDDRAKQFEEQMLPHIDTLYRAALSMTRSPTAADDLVQDTYVRAFQYFDQFREGTNSRAWLFRILTNLYINSYRKKNREPERVSYDEMEDFYLHSRLADAHRKGGASPEEIVTQKLEAEAIREAIEKLPVEYREVVVLADLNELAYQEIADMLEIPLGTVRSRLSRGRRLVQRSLWAYTQLD